MFHPCVKAIRYRRGWAGKLILQVMVEVDNEYYYTENPFPGTKPTKFVWRDASTEDITVTEIGFNKE